MLAELPEKSIGTIQDAARRLTGAARRKFEAAVAIDYCQGSPRRTESVFGWGRATVKAGLDQLQTGVARLDQFFKRERRKYNSVERCWGILEQHWNGAILSSQEAVLSWAQTMTCQRYFPDGTAVGDRVRQGSPSGAERSCSGWNHGCAGCHRLASGAS